MTTISAYAIAGLVNELRAQKGLKAWTTQQAYNYSRNGLLGHPKVEVEIEGVKEMRPNTNHQYTQDEVKAYLTKVANKLGLQVEESNEVEGQMELELPTGYVEQALEIQNA